jgi:hypothetical protein
LGDPIASWIHHPLADVQGDYSREGVKYRRTGLLLLPAPDGGYRPPKPTIRPARTPAEALVTAAAVRRLPVAELAAVLRPWEDENGEINGDMAHKLGELIDRRASNVTAWAGLAARHAAAAAHTRAEQGCRAGTYVVADRIYAAPSCDRASCPRCSARRATLAGGATWAALQAANAVGSPDYCAWCDAEDLAGDPPTIADRLREVVITIPQDRPARLPGRWAEPAEGAHLWFGSWDRSPFSALTRAIRKLPARQRPEWRSALEFGEKAKRPHLNLLLWFPAVSTEADREAGVEAIRAACARLGYGSTAVLTPTCDEEAEGLCYEAWKARQAPGAEHLPPGLRVFRRSHGWPEEPAERLDHVNYEPVERPAAVRNAPALPLVIHFQTAPAEAAARATAAAPAEALATATVAATRSADAGGREAALLEVAGYDLHPDACPFTRSARALLALLDRPAGGYLDRPDPAPLLPAPIWEPWGVLPDMSDLDDLLDLVSFEPAWEDEP